MSELSWLKRLACALVRDDSDANDLVQETWLVAAEHAPTDGRPLKPWLSRVALNLVSMRSRASKRRVLERPRSSHRQSRRHPTSSLAVSGRSESSPTRSWARRAVSKHGAAALLRGSRAPKLLAAPGSRRHRTPEAEGRARRAARSSSCGRAQDGPAVVAALAPLAVKQSAASVGSAALGVVLVKKLSHSWSWPSVFCFSAPALQASRRDKRAGRCSRSQARLRTARSLAAPRDSPAHIVVAVTDGAGPVADASCVALRPMVTSWSSRPRRWDRFSISRIGRGRSQHLPMAMSLRRRPRGRRGSRRPRRARARDRRPDADRHRDGRDRRRDRGRAHRRRAARHSMPRRAARSRWRSPTATAATSSPSERARSSSRRAIPIRGADALRRPRAGGSDRELRARARRCDRGCRARPPDEAARRRRRGPRDARLAGARARGAERTRREGRRRRQVPVRRACGPARTSFGARRQAQLARARRRWPRRRRAADEHRRPRRRTATIRGKVVDDTGAPASEVTVSASGGGAESGEATSDAAGAFVLEA